MYPPEAATGFAFEAGPPLGLAADVAVSLACLSVLAALATLLLRRRDLFDARTGCLLGLFVLAAVGAHLVGGLARAAPIEADLLRLAIALVALAAAAAIWPRLPRLLTLANPAALAREAQERRVAEARARGSERRARESEAQAAQLLAHLPEALFVLQVEADGRLLVEAVNPAFERMFGVQAGAVIGAPAESLLPSALLPAVIQRWRHAAASGIAEEYELTADLRGGLRSWQTRLAPIRGADGRVERLLGSVRDVTATRHLQQGLVQSARLATVGTMCAGLAHEASQPLNAATLWLRRLRAAGQKLPDAERALFARAVQVVEGQLRRSGDLIQRIRALAGEEPRDATCFDAATPVAAALRIAATQYAAEGITLALEGGGVPLPVRGSAPRLEQAVLQLLSNARDAVQDRRCREPLAPARIDVELGRAEGMVTITVRDSGAGVPDALADRIFDPFFTTKEPGRGTGLGLAFAAGVARGMGGGVATWNPPGGGACFRLELAAIGPGAECRAAATAAA